MEAIIARSVLDHKSYELLWDREEIHSIRLSTSSSDPEYILGPGLLDIQVNGYAGVDYNQVHEEFSILGQITRNLVGLGVTQHLPTIITQSKEQIGLLFQQAVKLVESNPFYKENIPGFHLEGPFISPEDGPRGAHDKKFVSAPNWDWVQFWQEKASGMIQVITLSPEWDESIPFIEKCIDAGIMVSIGHTKANQNQITKAVQAGASLSTHLGNGAHSILPRHPNYLWSQLAEKELYATVIADGFHLPKEVIQVFHQVKKEKLFLISDSVALAGMPAGEYHTPVGGKVTLDHLGKLHLRDHPEMLAGSAMNLLQGVNFLLKNHLTTLSEAWEMASIRPKRLIFPKHRPWSPMEKNDLILAKIGENSEIILHRIFKNWKQILTH